MKYLLSLLLFASFSTQSNEPHKKTYYEWKADEYHASLVIEGDSIENSSKGRVNIWNNGKIVGNVDALYLTTKTIQ